MAIADEAKTDAREVSRELWVLAKARVSDPRLVWGIPYFSAGLNGLTGGAHRGEMSIIAARPGVGKSFFVAQCAVAMAEYLLTDEGKRLHKDEVVKLVLCEMSAPNFQMRLACQRAKVSQRRVMTGKLTPEMQHRFEKALAELAELPIEYKDDPSGFEDTHQWLDRGSKTAWFAIDYIGIHPAGIPGLEAQQTAKVAFLSRGFRAYCRNGPPGLLIAQLNRDVEKAEDKRPMLSHLRDSGSLEQDASGIVGFIYRSDIYTKIPDEDRDIPRQCELIVAKQRNGPIGTVPMWWAPTLPGFVDESVLKEDME